MRVVSLSSYLPQQEKAQCQMIPIREKTTTDQQQHALALSDGSTAAQKADDEQEGSQCNQQVAHIEHLAELCWHIFNFPKKAEDGATVHLHPDPNTQDGNTRKLGKIDGQRKRQGESRSGEKS